MTQLSKNYGRVLYELGISPEAVKEAMELIHCEELMEALKNPTVSKKAKHNIVDRVFPEEMHNFMKLLCDYGSVSYIEEILDAYDAYVNEQKGIITASLICVTPPEKEQKEKIESFLMSEYGKSGVRLNIVTDESLIGGFVLRVNDIEYDWSLKGRISQLTGHLKNI
ncbi:MAG: ATP synthase F1 subunit delta [Lachnospiraceae bacterium]